MAKPPKPPKRKRKQTKKIDTSRVPSPKLAVMRALFIYIQDPGITLREVWSEYRYDENDSKSPFISELVSLPALQRAATRGNWAQRREDHWYETQERVLDELKSTTVQRELAEVDALEQLRQDAMEVLGEATPKTFEGVLNAIVRLDGHLTKKRERVMAMAAAAGVDPETGRRRTTNQLTGPALDDEFDDDEVDAMARALMYKRAGLDGSHAEEEEE